MFRQNFAYYAVSWGGNGPSLRFRALGGGYGAPGLRTQPGRNKSERRGSPVLAGDLLNDPGDVLQTPSRPASGAERLAVQGRRDSSQRMAVLAEVADFRQDSLLAGVWLNVLPVRAEAEPESDIA